MFDTHRMYFNTRNISFLNIYFYLKLSEKAKAGQDETKTCKLK